jgi:hypothetical protein
MAPLTGLLAVALVALVAGCDTAEETAKPEETVQEDGLPVPRAAEIRAEKTLNDYANALRDRDYATSCGLLTRAGKLQVYVSGEPPEVRQVLERAPAAELDRLCPQVLGIEYQDLKVPVGHFEVTHATQQGNELVVETDRAGTVRLSAEDFKVVSFPLAPGG